MKPSQWVEIVEGQIDGVQAFSVWLVSAGGHLKEHDQNFPTWDSAVEHVDHRFPGLFVKHKYHESAK